MEKEAKLQVLIQRLHGCLDGQLERLALFGSRARDEWRPDSDWDLLIVVSKRSHDVMDRIMTVITDFELEFSYDLSISPRILDRSEFDRLYESPFPFWRNLRRDEKPLWTKKP